MYSFHFAWGRLVVVGTLSLLVCSVSLVTSSAQEISPRAAELMDKYVEATGGAKAYSAVQRRIIRGKLEMPSRGISGGMVTYFQHPGKFYSEISTPAGIHRRGCNGRTAWTIEPNNEPRILTGLARVLAIRDGTLDRFGHWRELADKLEYAGEEEVDGKKCAKVVLTYKPIDPEAKETPITIYLDLATSLITQYTTEISRPNMLAKVTAVLDDYQKKDGIVLPHKMSLKTDALQYTVTLATVESNVPIEPGQFVLPRAIQELLVK